MSSHEVAKTQAKRARIDEHRSGDPAALARANPRMHPVFEVRIPSPCNLERLSAVQAPVDDASGEEQAPHAAESGSPHGAMGASRGAVSGAPSRAGLPLGELVETLPRLRAHLRDGGPRGEAEDLAQEVTLRALRASERFDSGRALWPWLRRIADRVRCDALRRNAERPEPRADLDPVAPLVAGSATGWASSSDDDPATRATASDLGATSRLVATLAPRERAALLRYHIDEMDLATIARELDVPIGTVKSDLSRARRRLAALVLAAAAAASAIVLVVHSARGRRGSPRDAELGLARSTGGVAAAAPGAVYWASSERIAVQSPTPQLRSIQHSTTRTIAWSFPDTRSLPDSSAFPSAHSLSDGNSYTGETPGHYSTGESPGND